MKQFCLLAIMTTLSARSKVLFLVAEKVSGHVESAKSVMSAIARLNDHIGFQVQDIQNPTRVFLFRWLLISNFVWVFNLRHRIELLILNAAVKVDSIMKKWETFKIRAADVMIGKPGPGCVSECMQCQTPVILKDTWWEVMAQEKHTIRWVKENEYGVIIKNYKRDLPDAIEKALEIDASEWPINNATDETAYAIVNMLKKMTMYKARLDYKL